MDDVPRRVVLLDSDWAHESAAAGLAISGHFVNVERPQAFWAVATEAAGQRQHVVPAGQTRERIVAASDEVAPFGRCSFSFRPFRRTTFHAWMVHPSTRRGNDSLAENAIWRLVTTTHALAKVLHPVAELRAWPSRLAWLQLLVGVHAIGWYPESIAKKLDETTEVLPLARTEILSCVIAEDDDTDIAAVRMATRVSALIPQLSTLPYVTRAVDDEVVADISPSSVRLVVLLNFADVIGCRSVGVIPKRLTGAMVDRNTSHLVHRFDIRLR